MLMMVSSGLSRYEAQKAQQTVTPRPNTINKASLFLPLLIMTAGVSGLISVITRNWLLTVVIGVLLSMMMAVIVY
ncbi:type IIB calcium ATPase, partial [Lacticaseibacillus paracasei subsp. paracasei Lpp48]